MKASFRTRYVVVPYLFGSNSSVSLIGHAIQRPLESAANILVINQVVSPSHPFLSVHWPRQQWLDVYGQSWRLDLHPESPNYCLWRRDPL